MTPAKSCDGCGLCCKLIGVKELEKAPHVWCRYFKRDKGCAVYEVRPGGCADFACDWLLDDQLDEAWKPDRAGFVLHTSGGGKTLNVDVDPANPTAWKRAPYAETLALWARRGAAEGMEVLIWVARRCWRLEAAGGLRDLGVQRDETRFASGGAMRRKGSGKDWPASP